MYKKIAKDGDNNVYLNEDEKAEIYEAYDKLFDTLQTRETDKGVELYQFAGETEARNTQARMDMTSVKYQKNIDIHTVIMNNNKYHLVQKENKPKIADDDVTITPVKITEKEVPNLNISDFADFVMKTLDKDSVHIDATNEDIGVSKSNVRRGRKKSKNKEKQAALAKIKELFRIAQYSGFEENDGQEKHKNIDGQDVYHTAMRYGNKLYSVQFKVDNLKNRGDRKYAGHSIEEIQIAPAAERSRNLSGTLVQTDAIHNISLAVLRGKVKSINYNILDKTLTQKAKQDVKGSFTPSKNLIQLFKDADASTLPRLTEQHIMLRK